MKKNVAILGYGGQGAWHGDRILQSDVTALAGVYDIRQTRNDAAARHGIRVYDDYTAMLDDNEVDIVVVATPNDLHMEQSIQALRAGKHVVCEKPVAMNSEELRQIYATAEETGKLFTVHQNRRWDVDYLAIRQLLESGEIGAALNIESRIHGSRGIPSDWRGQKEHGGGMILDWGVHLIDQILQLYPGQKIVKVYCTVSHITNREVDDGFKLYLYFDSGVQAFVEVGTYNFIALPRFYVQCEKGSALIADWREPVRVARCKAWNEKDVLPVQTAAGITKTMAPRNEITLDEYENDRPESDVHDFYRNFCRAIDGQEEMLITHDEVMRVMRVMEAAFRSAGQGQAVLESI